jgi:hypothetical protein
MKLFEKFKEDIKKAEEKIRKYPQIPYPEDEVQELQNEVTGIPVLYIKGVKKSYLNAIDVMNYHCWNNYAGEDSDEMQGYLQEQRKLIEDYE